MNTTTPTLGGRVGSRNPYRPQVTHMGQTGRLRAVVASRLGSLLRDDPLSPVGKRGTGVGTALRSLPVLSGSPSAVTPLPWLGASSDEGTNDHAGQHELQLSGKATGSMPADTAREEIVPARAQYRQTVPDT